MEKANESIKKEKNSLLITILRWMFFNILTGLLPLFLILCFCYSHGIEFYNFVSLQDFLLITFSVSISALSVETEKEKISSYATRFIFGAISIASAIINISFYSSMLEKTIMHETYLNENTPDNFSHNLFFAISLICLFLNILMVIIMEYIYNKNEKDSQDVQDIKPKDKDINREEKEISVIQF